MMKNSLIFKTFAGVFLLTALFSCSSYAMGNSKINLSFWLGLGKLPDDYQGIIIVENTPELQRIFKKKTKYITWGIGSDSGSGISSKLFPEKLQIKYAIVRTNTDVYYSSLIKDKEQIVLRHAQSLPPSAWRTYTIYPKQVIGQAKRMGVKDPRYIDRPAQPYVPSNFKDGTVIKLTLYIDEYGNITQSIEHTFDLGRVWKG